MKNFSKKNVSFLQHWGRKLVMPALASIALSGVVKSSLSAQDQTAPAAESTKVERSVLEMSKDFARKYAIYVNVLSFLILVYYMMMDSKHREGLKAFMTSLGDAKDLNRFLTETEKELNGEIFSNGKKRDLKERIAYVIAKIDELQAKKGVEINTLKEFKDLMNKLQEMMKEKKWDLNEKELKSYSLAETEQMLIELNSVLTNSERSLEKVPLAGLATTALAAVTVFLSGSGQKDFALGIAISKAAVGFFYLLFMDLKKEVREEASLYQFVSRLENFLKKSIISKLGEQKNGKNF